MTAQEALAEVFRADSGHIVALLVKDIGDFELAEDAVQDAILEALEHWEKSGVPERPTAWLVTTARRKAINRVKRDANYQRKIQLLGRLEQTTAHSAVTSVDDRLALIFMCCHPALRREAQIALTLRSILGLTTAQLAKAFLTSEATMTKRIGRAKRKIVEAAIPFSLPSPGQIRERLREVLTVIYVLFGEGYLSTGPDNSERFELASDAEWLTTLLMRLMPEEPEVAGLLALIRLHQARRSARFDVDGHLVLIQEQDRTRWDHAAVLEAVSLLNRTMRLGRPGPYQVQAAIAACHCLARSWEGTDWSRVVDLYDLLISFGDSPIAKLNRAIALKHRDGPEEALRALDPLESRLAEYHLFHATRAALLQDMARNAEAMKENRIAARLTRNPAELHLLQQRLEGLG